MIYPTSTGLRLTVKFLGFGSAGLPDGTDPHKHCHENQAESLV